jgi:hypothetical protein
MVPSSRIAAIATLALNSALCFFRMFVISNPLAYSHFRGETLSQLPANSCPVLRGQLINNKKAKKFPENIFLTLIDESYMINSYCSI